MNEHLLKENRVHVTRRPHVGEHLLERNVRLSVHSADKAPSCRNGSGRTRLLFSIHKNTWRMLRALFTSRFHVVSHWEHQRTPWISRCLKVFGRFPGSRALPGSNLSECCVPASAAAKAHLLHRCEVKCSWRMMTRVWNSSRCRSCMMGPGKYPKPEEHRHAPKTTTASMPFPPVMR